MSMSKKTVKLTLEVPKGVIDFLTDLFTLGGYENSIPKFIEKEVAQIPESIMGALPDTWFDMDYIRKKYGLDKK
jgi:methyl coenzyme M reductase alpha subunit